jgi:hypothetical protein
MVVHLKLDISVAFDAAPTIVAPAAQCFWCSPIVINLASLVTVLPVGPTILYDKMVQIKQVQRIPLLIQVRTLLVLPMVVFQM